MGRYESFPGAAEPQVIRAEGDTVTIPDAHLLFSGDFSRSGADLVIAGEGTSVIVADYFGDAGSPTLAAPNGAVLLPDVVSALAGPLAPGQYAQADDGEPAEGIGSVVTLTGSATAQRSDGTVVDLTVDSRLGQGDVVETASGSALGIVFDDGAVFNLNAESRMVLNELVYEPGGGDNSMLFSLVQGVFAFVAGQVAPTGEMRIDTPAASMGIRGTSGIVKLETVDGVAVFRVVPDPVTNEVGTIVLYSPGTDIILVVMESSDSQWAIDPATGQVIEQPADPGDADLIEQLHQTYIDFAGIVDDPGDTQFAEGGGSGLPTQFSLTSAETAAIVALAGGALPQVEPLAGEPVSSGLDFGYGPEGMFDPPPPPPPQPQPGSSDPQQLPPGGFTGDDFGSVDEDGTTATTGQLVFAGGTGLIEPLVIQGTYGTFVIDADGTWVYTLDNDSAAVQALGEGVSAEESFAVVSADGSETQFVTITVQGVNDVPTVTGTTTGAVADDGAQVATGTITVADPDAGESSVQPQINVAGTYGAFSILANGNWTYTLDDADPAVQALAEGETVTDSFTVTSLDGTATETVSVTVTGANDAPVAQNDALATNENAAVDGNVLDDNGNGPDDDAEGDVLTVTHVNGSTANVGSQIVLASGALLLLNADGSFAYDPNGQFDLLGPGDSDQDSFTYTVADGQGGSDTATVTLTINGVNDAPVATYSEIHTNEGVSAEGMLTGSDVNPGDTLTYSLEQEPLNGSVEIAADGSYVYVPGEGVTEDSFMFRVTDGQGAFNTATVSVFVATGDAAKNITGTPGNDVLIGSALSDVLSGEAGDDVLRSGGAPQDYEGVDILNGGHGNDRLFAEGGFVMLRGGPGHDMLTSTDAGGHWDYVLADYRESPGAIEANLTGNTIGDLAPGEISDGYGTVDHVSNVHVLVDTDYNDTVHVDSTYDNSAGNWIEVRLSGGDDQVTFTGVDFARISYAHAEGPVQIDLDAGTGTDLGEAINVGSDTFEGANAARGSSFDDVLLGRSDGGDDLRGSAGDDYIDGRGGINTISFSGAAFGIHVDLSQDPENRVLNDGHWNAVMERPGVDEVHNVQNVNGSEWDDLIVGDDGSNELNGSLGNDTLIGGLGNDVLIGGDGADRFEYGSPDEGGDTILDFAVSEDVLVIDATAFGGGLVGGEPLPESRFVAGESPTADGEVGQFLYDTSSGDLFWDGDGIGGDDPVHIATFDDPDDPDYVPPELSETDFEIVGVSINSFGDIAAAVDAGSEPAA